MKRRLAVVGTALLLSACGGGLLPAAAPSPTPPEQRVVRIATVASRAFIELPLTLGARLGYDAAEGLEVRIQDVQSGNDALAALGRGEADLVSIPYEFTLRAQSQGNGLTMILLWGRSPGTFLTVGSSHVAQVRTMKDLVGHPVGITAPGTAAETLVRLLAIRDGVDPNSIPMKTIGSGQRASTAIASGAVWAGVKVDPAATEMEQDQMGTVLPESDTRNPVVVIRLYGGLQPSNGLITTSDFIRRNPHTLEALARAGVQTLHYIASHSAEEISAHMPSDFIEGRLAAYVASLKRNLPMFSRDGLMPSDAPARVLMNLQLVVPGFPGDGIDLRQTYDNSFAQKANADSA